MSAFQGRRNIGSTPVKTHSNTQLLATPARARVEGAAHGWGAGQARGPLARARVQAGGRAPSRILQNNKSYRLSVTLREPRRQAPAPAAPPGLLPRILQKTRCESPGGKPRRRRRLRRRRRRGVCRESSNFSRVSVVVLRRKCSCSTLFYEQLHSREKSWRSRIFS